MGSQSLLVGLATAETQDEILDVLRGFGLAPSGKVYNAEALVSDQVSTPFIPAAGRPFYLTLDGGGTATVTVVYSRDDGPFVAELTMVDGGAPITLNKGAYAGLPGVLTLQVAEVGVEVAVHAEGVTGGVTVQFSQ